MNGFIALLPPRARSNMMAFPETDAVATRRRQSVRPSASVGHMAIQPAKRKALRIQRTNDLRAASLCFVLEEECSIVMMGCFNNHTVL